MPPAETQSLRAECRASNAVRPTHERVECRTVGCGAGDPGTPGLGTGKDAEPALPLLEKLKLSPDDAVRRAATEAVKKIE